MRPRLFVAALAVVMLVSSAGAASAGTQAKTRVTNRIVESGFRYKVLGGTVESKHPFKCAKDRRVVVFRQKWRHGQDPKTDKVVGSDTASSRGERYKWSARMTRADVGSGARLYARVRKTESCSADTSRSVRVLIAGRSDPPRLAVGG